MRLSREQADRLWQMAEDAGDGAHRLAEIFPSMRRHWFARARLEQMRWRKRPRGASDPNLGAIVSEAIEKAFAPDAMAKIFESSALFRILERR